MTQQIAIIIGAGPAGLTAAYELLHRTSVRPIIFEETADIGGISKTVVYKGNRMDIGGHRFFSKSNRVMNWWQEILPLAGAPAKDDILLDRDVILSKKMNAPDPEKTDRVMLIRNRLSRILFLRCFFDYPISFKWRTFKKLGVFKLIKIGGSYLKSKLFPIKHEASLEDFFINRFGRTLYSLFFEDYTEKVWGLPCREINPEWGAQRIKGLSLTKTLLHALKSMLKKDRSVSQKNVETTLINQFTYPKLGPGQLWEEVAKKIILKGGKIHFKSRVSGLTLSGNRVTGIKVSNTETSGTRSYAADFVFSTMPVKELVQSITPSVPQNVAKVAKGLVYRDFITVGVLLKKMLIQNETGIPSLNNVIPDNWIYVQERDVRLGRIQIFNNWSPYLVKNPDHVWLGLEYFCTRGDDLWEKSDKEMSEFAVNELEIVGLIQKDDVLDFTVIKVPNTYPAYFGSYDHFDVIRNYTDQISNLFLVGRNGMHKYNNADHSMLSAMVAVDNIVNSVTSKNNIWCVNTEEEYHED